MVKPETQVKVVTSSTDVLRILNLREYLCSVQLKRIQHESVEKFKSKIPNIRKKLERLIDARQLGIPHISATALHIVKL